MNKVDNSFKNRLLFKQVQECAAVMNSKIRVEGAAEAMGIGSGLIIDNTEYRVTDIDGDEVTIVLCQ